ncbi:MAG: molybdopterin-binding protein [Candidatus Eremiobacteraeota bacterium]|nr:molybdopterin-binding protein [Candidatus Eremiobacteraeota bacterium]
MKRIKVKDAMGKKLAHDITKIIPGKFKDAVFKHGQTIGEEDVDELLNLGEDEVFILEGNEEDIHEDDAGLIIAQKASGDGLKAVNKNEAWIDVVAVEPGMFKVEKNVLNMLNMIDEVIFATLPSYVMVEKNRTVAKVKIRPLYISKEKLGSILQVTKKHGKAIHIQKINNLKIGLIIASTEVFNGRIKDGFHDLIKSKMDEYGLEVDEKIILPDNAEKISDEIINFKNNGMDLILVTGGMSVDPCDTTPEGIEKSGAKTVSYGMPFSPGAMLMLAYLDSTPVIGIPSGVLFRKRSSFDVILPHILIGEKLNKEDIRSLGEGGLCWNCRECHFPVCTFGKQEGRRDVPVPIK